jgi:hypothetical protein
VTRTIPRSKPTQKNERTKHSYFAFLKEAKRLNESSIDAVAKSLDRFETYCGRQPFARFHREQAIAFKAAPADQFSNRSRERLSKATIYARSFTQRRGCELFQHVPKDMAVAKATRETRFPIMGEIEKALGELTANFRRLQEASSALKRALAGWAKCHRGYGSRS